MRAIARSGLLVAIPLSATPCLTRVRRNGDLLAPGDAVRRHKSAWDAILTLGGLLGRACAADVRRRACAAHRGTAPTLAVSDDAYDGMSPPPAREKAWRVDGPFSPPRPRISPSMVASHMPTAYEDVASALAARMAQSAAGGDAGEGSGEDDTSRRRRRGATVTPLRSA